MNKYVREIVELTEKVNGFRSHVVDNGLPTVFLWYSGHIGKIDIAIHSKGWKDHEGPDIEFSLGAGSKDIDFQLCIEALEKLLINPAVQAELYQQDLKELDAKYKAEKKNLKEKYHVEK